MREMFEPTIIIAVAALIGLAITATALLVGWRGWLNGGYADINQAMVKVAAGYIFRITADCDDEAHRRDLAQAKNLLLKHGLAEIAQQVPSLAQCAQTTGTQLSLV